MRHESTAVRTLTSASDADPWENIQDFHPKAVQVWGSFVGTWKLQAKLHPDADYDDIVTGKTAGDIIAIDLPVAGIKLVCTAFTSGVINGVVSGFNARTE